MSKISKNLKKEIAAKIRASLVDVELASTLEEMFDILENIIDETSQSLDYVNEAMDEAQEIN